MASIPANATSLPLAFARWAARHKVRLQDTGCSEWAGCYVTIAANLSAARTNPKQVRKTPSWPRSWANFGLL